MIGSDTKTVDVLHVDNKVKIALNKNLEIFVTCWLHCISFDNVT